MPTTAQNTVSIIDHDQMPQSLPVISAYTINEGDLVAWDVTNSSVCPLNASGATESGKTLAELGEKYFLGVALGSNKPEVYGGEEARPELPVGVKMVVYCNTTASDKLHPFDELEIGADAQTVKRIGAYNVAKTAKAIGYALLDPPATVRAKEATPVPEEVEGGSGVRLRVLLAAKLIPATLV